MLQQALQELSAADCSDANAMRNPGLPLRRLAKLGHGGEPLKVGWQYMHV